MIEQLIKIENVSTEYSISDSKGEVTHTLKILGYVRGQDKNGMRARGMAKSILTTIGCK